MTDSRDIYLMVYEGEDWAVKARVTDEEGTRLSQATCTSADVRVFLMENGTPGTEVYSETIADENAWVQGSLTVVLLADSYATTGGWSKDTTGWNANLYLAFTELETGGAQGSGAITIKGGQTYLVEWYFFRSGANKAAIILRQYTKVLPLRSI